MIFPCHVEQIGGGQWRARSSEPAVGEVEAAGPTRAEALEKLRAEIRYRLEWCPCSGVGDTFVELEVS
ncbi:MAG: hypothetical protein AMXMBFR13_16270 [Phycisphaerae bacterium]